MKELRLPATGYRKSRLLSEIILYATTERSQQKMQNDFGQNHLISNLFAPNADLASGTIKQV